MIHNELKLLLVLKDFYFFLNNEVTQDESYSIQKTRQANEIFQRLLHDTFGKDRLEKLCIFNSKTVASFREQVAECMIYFYY